MRAEKTAAAAQPLAELRMFVYFSDLLGLPVLTASGELLGKLHDLKVKLGELFPRVTALVLKERRGRKYWTLDWHEIHRLNRHIRVKPQAETKLLPLKVNPDEILLREEIIDKQVVDTYGARIKRVNDIHLLITGEELRLVHVDIGTRGILRRLGWLRLMDKITNWLFAYQLPEKLISWKYIQPLASDPNLKNLKLNVTARKLHEIHPSDLADIMEGLDAQSRAMIFQSLDLETAAQALEEVEPKYQASLIEASPIERASDILEAMAPDEATDLLADLPEEKKKAIIQKIEPAHRQKLEELLRFKEGTAGSIMTKDFLALRPEQTIGEAIEAFRQVTHPLETVAYLYIIDEAAKLLGVITLRHLLLFPKETVLSKIMNTNLITVKAGDNLAAVAEKFQKYKFLILPVVNADGVLIGVITFQDIFEAWYID